MARLTFCDYHNMIAILEKYEHNHDFHQIVDFVEAFHIRYALTINPTVYVSYIPQFWSIARFETTNAETKILATVDGKPRTISKSSIRRNLLLNDEAGISSLPDAELFVNLTLMGTIPLFDSMLVTMGEGSGTPTEPYHTPTPEASQSPQHELSSSSLPPVITETIPTIIPTDTPPLRQYTRRAKRIAQSTALLTTADEPASPLKDDSQAMASKIAAQDLEISQLKASVKLLEDKDGGGAEPSRDDATIKGRSLATGEEAGERRSEDTEELVNVLTSLDAANILTSGGVQVVSVPPAAEVAIMQRKGKDGRDRYAKEKKLQEQIDIQLARAMKEQMAREDQRMSEEIARDAKIARIHAEEELQMLIDGLDRKNEVIARHLHDYEQASTDLSTGEKIELINKLVKYKDHHSKILKYQAQQSKPLSKKQQREFYISVLKSHAEEGERVKRKGLRLEQESTKKVKTSDEDLKEMMQLIPVEEVYVEALQLDREDMIQLWTLVKETLSIRQATRDKEKELWLELKRLFEPDVEDQLWTHTQALMYHPVEWRLYDSCGIYHVLSRDQEIFMPVERDYPLRKGLAIVMISNKLQVENYS
uniref:Xylulose kinase-1 n=1 Tax=Tanacetum cinerariifolium TaxID=118510 RepID=A0A6L2M9R0_TANCI|nr:hypothetical protein [Tanacetum cinerariifolium]